MSKFESELRIFLKRAVSITPYEKGGRELMNVGRDAVFVEQGHISVSPDGQPFTTEYFNECTSAIIQNTHNGRHAFAHFTIRPDFDELRRELKPIRRGSKRAITYGNAISSLTDPQNILRDLGVQIVDRVPIPGITGWSMVYIPGKNGGEDRVLIDLYAYQVVVGFKGFSGISTPSG